MSYLLASLENESLIKNLCAVCGLHRPEKALSLLQPVLYHLKRHRSQATEEEKGIQPRGQAWGALSSTHQQLQLLSSLAPP